MSEISGYIARMAGVSHQTVYDWQADRFEIPPPMASRGPADFADAGIPTLDERDA